MIGQRSEYTSLTKLMFLRKIAVLNVSKVKKHIRMGITIFKFFTWGGISSDIRSEITFYGSANAVASP